MRTSTHTHMQRAIEIDNISAPLSAQKRITHIDSSYYTHGQNNTDARP